MSIVGGLDVHHRQITFDYVDTDTGRLQRGRITPACRPVLRRWLAERFAGRTDVEFAVEACAGWRFVVEECERAGIAVSLAEPADTAAARGRKRRAKTDPGRRRAATPAAGRRAATHLVDPTRAGTRDPRDPGAVQGSAR
jgi:transposase